MVCGRVRHPEIIDVLQTALRRNHVLRNRLNACQPIPFWSQSHLSKPGSEPAGLQFAVKAGRPVCCVKQQPRLPGDVFSQVLCDVGMQVDFSFSGIRFEVLNDAWSVLFDLLLDMIVHPLLMKCLVSSARASETLVPVAASKT